jgi:hypothetical protein
MSGGTKDSAAVVTAAICSRREATEQADHVRRERRKRAARLGEPDPSPCPLE